MYTRFITEKIIVDPYTVRFKTAKPHAVLPVDISTIYIVPKRMNGNSTDDFNAGRATIGTGPYKLKRWARGERLELQRNEHYWGDKPAWEQVSMLMLQTPAARVAALLAGDVDAIDGVPPADVSKLKANQKIRVYSTVSNRLVFLEMDIARAQTPYVTGHDGKALAQNPLADVRVRRAMSMALNRVAIVGQVMEGHAFPAGQLVPQGSYAYVPSLTVPAYDLAGAQNLLAEAGYAKGFRLTLHGPAGRYVNDEKVLQTVAQMWSRIGIATKIETFPVAVYFARLAKQDASVMLYGWGGGTGHVSSFLKSLLASYNPDKGYGSSNFGRYANAQVDALVDQAYATMDAPKQEGMWQQATRIAMAEQGLIPLHHQVNIWATRQGLRYYPRTDERSLAWEFLPVAGEKMK